VDNPMIMAKVPAMERRSFHTFIISSLFFIDTRRLYLLCETTHYNSLSLLNLESLTCSYVSM
jgi:hypothetical protein